MSALLFPFSFRMMRLIGVWPSSNKKRTWSDYFAIIRGTFLFSLSFTFTAMQIVQMIIFMTQGEEFLDGSFLCATILNVCFKMIMMSTSSQFIIDVKEFFTKREYTAENDHERDIQHYYLYFIKQGAYLEMLFGLAGITMMAVDSIISALPIHALPFKAWSPLDLSDYSIYIATFSQQHIAHAASALMGCTFDIFIMSVMLQCCAQFGILKHRLENFQRNLAKIRSENNSKNHQVSSQKLETGLIVKYIKHHSEIYRFVQYSNEAFARSIFIQYTTSSFIICASVYTLSMMDPLTSEFMGLFCYTFAMFVQLLMFCGCGNEVTVQGLSVADTIYSMDWDLLNIPNKKTMVVMMLRSQMPLTFAGGHLFILSLSSLCSILKLAYSIFNFLS